MKSFILLFLLSLAASVQLIAQDGLINDDFSTGNNFSWQAATPGATSQVSGGKLVVTMALQSSGKYRGDFKRNDGVTFHAGNYPVIAVKMNKPPRCNFFFDTNLGSYNNANNNGTKINTATGAVYYWDISAGKLGTTTLPTDQTTILSLFQFKVADVVLTAEELALNDISFEVDWVKSFPNVEALRTAIGANNPPTYSFSGSFSHPGLLHNAADLQRIKSQVTNQLFRPYESYQLLLNSNKASATYVMAGPFQYITRDASVTVNGVGGGAVKNGVESDVMAAYYNALQWNITGNQAHALKAVEILNAYANTTTQIVGGDAELNGLYGFMLANAAELMKHTYSGWSSTESQQCATMLKNVFYPVLGNFRPCGHGNWDIICMKALMSIAIYCDDVSMFNRVVNYFYNGEGNGSIDNYILTDAGQTQESNRDQPHVMLALGSLAELSEMALKQGLDLYTASNNAIMRGYEYTAKYNLGYSVPYETSYDYCEKNYTDYTPEAISANGRGNLRAVFEIAYNHYSYRKGLQMPYTLEVMKQMGPEGAPFGADNPGYGSLLFYLNTQPNHPFVAGPPIDPNAGLIDDNFTNSDSSWKAVTSGSSAVLENGELKVTLAVTSGKGRGDIRRMNGAVLYPNNFPILAIKMKKPAVANITFDTNLGSYRNGSNKWTGKVGDDIYYFDIKQFGFGAGPVYLSSTSPTTLSTFQFKVADITSGETNYTVDWVKTVKSVNDLLALEPTTGLINDNFTTTNDGWVANTPNASAFQENGHLRVQLAKQTNGSYRGDIKRSAGATLFPANYPIVAVKLKKPAVVNLTFDTNLGAFGNGSNRQTGKVGESIYYFDLRQKGFGASNTLITDPAALTLFQFKVADITSGETNYQVDWVKTVKTVEELQALVIPMYQTISFPAMSAKLFGDADFSPATASSGLAMQYSTTDPAVASVVNGMLHLAGAGTTTITAGQPGDNNYYPADAVSQSLTVNKNYYVDNDDDGFGAGPAVPFAVNEAPDGYANNNIDCDDTKLLYTDNDGDGLGHGAPAACGVDNNSDCDDTNPVALVATIPDAYAQNSAVDDKNTIYIGYGTGALLLQANATGGTVPYSYQWSTSADTKDITVTAAGHYEVFITDAHGCTAQASIEISIMDVTCGNNTDKVMICHNNKIMCINSGSVQDHLNHGDKLGSCKTPTTSPSISEKLLKPAVVFPNPTSSWIEISVDQLVEGSTFRIFNTTGTNVMADRLLRNRQRVSIRHLANGVYFLQLLNADKMQVIKIVKQ